MGAMKELMIELDEYWTPAKVGCYWHRVLPDEQTVTISSFQTGHFDRSHPNFRSGYRIGFSGDMETLEVDGLVDALVTVGQIARQQLEDLKRRWTAV